MVEDVPHDTRARERRSARRSAAAGAYAPGFAMRAILAIRPPALSLGGLLLRAEPLIAAAWQAVRSESSAHGCPRDVFLRRDAISASRYDRGPRYVHRSIAPVPGPSSHHRRRVVRAPSSLQVRVCLPARLSACGAPLPCALLLRPRASDAALTMLRARRRFAPPVAVAGVLQATLRTSATPCRDKTRTHGRVTGSHDSEAS